MLKHVSIIGILAVLFIIGNLTPGMAKDQTSTSSPKGDFNTEAESTDETDSWTTWQKIGNAPGMDEYRWGNKDFGWKHTFADAECRQIDWLRFKIRAWDVDFAEGERDAVYVDGVKIGYLEGSDEQWSTTEFYLDPAYLADGKLKVFIDIDETKGEFAVTIDWSKIVVQWDCEPPVADFTSCPSPAEGIGELCVEFKNLSSCAKRYLWDFGDGATSTKKNPTHCFTDVHKYYTVTLTAYGCCGENTVVKENYVVVHKPSNAMFNGSPIVGAPGFAVHFVNNSGGGANHFLWDYGDGESEELKHDYMNKIHPTHIYEKEGEYTVSLKIWGNGGDDNLTVPNLIYVDPNYALLELISSSAVVEERYGWDNVIDHDIITSDNSRVLAINGDAWAAFSLDTLRSIHKVRMLANTALGTSFTNHLAQNFDILVSLDGVEYTKAYSGLLTSKQDWEVFELEPMVAKYIKLALLNARGEDSPYVTLCEFQLFGEVATELGDGGSMLNNAGFVGSLVPSEFGLSQNYPNPFNPETIIRYQLPEVADVVLNIYNINGQLINTLVNGNIKEGYHQVVWDGRDGFGNIVAGGLYIFSIRATNDQSESFHLAKKMTFMK